MSKLSKTNFQIKYYQHNLCKIIKINHPHKLNLKKEWQLRIKMGINQPKFQVLVEC